MSYNIGRLLYQLPQQLKLYYRKYESLYKKKTNKLWALNFNKTCIYVFVQISISYVLQ